MIIRNILLLITLASLGLTGCVNLNKHGQEKAIKIAKNAVSNPALSIDTQVGRYSTILNRPTHSEVNPLLAVSTFNFPIKTYSIGQAVKHVLLSTGYQLSPKLSKEVKHTLQLPLPLTDRKLGPMNIQTALVVLMGDEVYDLQRDPLNRLVNFKLKPSIALSLGVKTNA